MLFLLFFTGSQIGIQRKLLNRKIANLRIEYPFLQSLVGVMGPKWPYFYPLLSDSRNAGEQRQERKKAVISFLEDWQQREHPTYGDLIDILNGLYVLPSSQSSLTISPRTANNILRKLMSHNDCPANLFITYLCSCHHLYHLQ